MFRDAYAKACKFTCPVVQNNLTFEGKITGGAAAFIVINQDGWIVTAGHVMKDAINALKSEQDAIAWGKSRDAIKADTPLTANQRDKKIRALGSPNKKAIRRSAVGWNVAGQLPTVVDISILDVADLAVGRLNGFQKGWIAQYPVFKDPSKDFSPGASLCKLGYPFVEFTPTYDAATNSFSVPPEQQTIAFFPIEGIYTRELNVPTEGAKFPIKFVETSSPGLRGQSGGPTFDAAGSIWAIQSQTRHLPLGFSPEVKQDGKIHKEHQFLNVGMGVYVETMLGFFEQSGIKCDVA